MVHPYDPTPTVRFLFGRCKCGGVFGERSVIKSDPFRCEARAFLTPNCGRHMKGIMVRSVWEQNNYTTYH